MVKDLLSIAFARISLIVVSVISDLELPRDDVILTFSLSCDRAICLSDAASASSGFLFQLAATF